MAERDLKIFEDDTILLDLAVKQLSRSENFQNVFKKIGSQRRKKILREPINERGDTLLHLAVILDSKTAVEELLTLEVDVNAENCDKATPLYYVKSRTVAKRLVRKGANINAKDFEGTSILTAAVLRGNNSIVRFLLKNKANSVDTKKYLHLPPSCDDRELFNI